MSFGDPTHAELWAAAERGELLVQRCEDCGEHQHYGRPHCMACESERVTWVRASGRGTVYAVTVVHVGVLPGLDPPYGVAIVELDEGPRLLSRLVGDDALDAAIGDAVEVRFEPRDDAPPLPVFARAG
jgi:uncharacterized OB-fold protein